MEFKKPDCATWKIWEGQEVEGGTDIGELTLFVREGDPRRFLSNYKRVWFCKEFTDYETILEVYKTHKVCFEVTLESMPLIPQAVKDAVQLYLKIECIGLKANDHVCVGTAFKDEAFLIGKGHIVVPSQYSEDKELV